MVTKSKQASKRYIQVMTTKDNQITCTLCSGGHLEFLYHSKDRNRLVDGRMFSIMVCRSCGLGYTIPRLKGAELSRYYPSTYYGLNDNLQIEASNFSRRMRVIRVTRIKKYIGSGKLLDVGAGAGMFLKTAIEEGFEAEGLEISRDAAAFGKDVWKLNIRQGDFQNVQFPSNHYQVVTLSHVLEHLPNPLSAIRKLHDIIEPGGLLVISVPNFGSLQARLFRARWFHLDVPRHLFHFSPSVLSKLLESEDFVVKEINYFSEEHNWAGILGSIMRLSPPEELFLHKLARKTIGSALTKSVAFIESLVGRGGTFELYAFKK